MKFISSFFRFIAYILMLIVLFALPFALFARNVGGILFSPDAIVELVDDNFLDGEIAADLSQQVITQMLRSDAAPEDEQPQNGAEDFLGELLQQGLASLSDRDWADLFRLVAPREVVAGTIQPLLEGFFDWIDSDDPYPTLAISTAPWKQSLSANTGAVLEIMLRTLPACTPEQLAQMVAEGDTALPLCRPDGELYRELLQQASVGLPASFDALPDEVDLGARFQQSGADLTAAKQALRRTRLVLNQAWLVVLGIYLLAIPLGARSAAGIFKWGGWPLLLAGIATLVFAFFLLSFERADLVGLGQRIFQEVPPVILAMIQATMSAIISAATRPMFLQAAATIALGGASLGVALVLASRGQNQPLPPADVPPQMETVQEESPAQSPQSPPEPPPDSDEDKPTGMFG